jgi:hypothetical protein
MRCRLAGRLAAVTPREHNELCATMNMQSRDQAESKVWLKRAMSQP